MIDPIEKKVRDYLSGVGIRKHKSWPVFHKKMSSKFGRLWQHFDGIVDDRQSGNNTDPYEIKNDSLDFSIAIAEQYYSDFYVHFLAWLEREQIPEPQRVLDIGCENGILTTYFAKTWPEAEVIGIDKNAKALQVAKELSERASISNVQYRQMEVSEISRQVLGPFDLVFSSVVMHEALGDAPENCLYFSFPSFWRVQDVIPDKFPATTTSTLGKIQGLLAQNDARFITVDRVTGTENLLWWYKCLEASGFDISLARSYALEWKHFNPDSPTETFSVTVCLPGREEFRPVEPGEALSMLSFRELGNKPHSYEGPLAEALYGSLAPQRLLAFANFDYRDGSGMMRMEVSSLHGIAVSYQTTDKGYRKLEIRPRLAVAELVRLLDGFADSMRANAEVEFDVTEYGIQELKRYEAVSE